jgi:predicted nucleotidyltransferase
MQPTPYPEVNKLLEVILAGIRANIGDKLVGLYAFGSLVTGDFNLARSDLDLAAVLTEDLDGEAFERLSRMHAEIAQKYPAWDDRIEVGYIAAEHLREFDPTCTIAVISPGEPFHFRAAEYGWLFNLNVLRAQGLTLAGPPPATLISPISKEELDRGLIDLMRMWREWTDDPDPHLKHSQQAYPIMTMCRALRAFRTGDFVSKNEAVRWAALELPEWSALILQSVKWREEPDGDYGDPDDSYPRTLAFTRYVIDLIIAEPQSSGNSLTS